MKKFSTKIKWKNTRELMELIQINKGKAELVKSKLLISRIIAIFKLNSKFLIFYQNQIKVINKKHTIK